MLYLKLILSSLSAKKALNDVPAGFKPYNALVIINTFPTRSCIPGTYLHSSLARIQTFSRFGAVRYAFYISPLNISSSFNAAINRIIRTESLETTVL